MGILLLTNYCILFLVGFGENDGGEKFRRIRTLGGVMVSSGLKEIELNGQFKF